MNTKMKLKPYHKIVQKEDEFTQGVQTGSAATRGNIQERATLTAAYSTRQVGDITGHPELQLKNRAAGFSRFFFSGFG